jgi:type IV secretion system protein VirD4
VILHVLYAEPDKSVAGVLRVLTDPERPIDELLEAMLHTRHLPSGPHPTVAGAARAMLDRAENERSGVKSTATSFLEIYRDPLMAANTSSSDFTIADLMCAERPVSLYFVVPTSDIERTRPVVRLLLNVIGRRLTEHLQHVDVGPGMAPAGGTAQPAAASKSLQLRWWKGLWTRARTSVESVISPRLQRKRRELLCLIDEFPQLGRIPIFANGLSYIAGYGLRCLLIAQSFKQLEEVYGRSNSVIDNCINRVTYGTTCDQTAERIARLLGNQSRVKLQISTTKRPGLFGGEQESRTYQEYGRPLKTVDEILSMPFPEAIVMTGECRPYLAKKLLYYQDPRFRDRACNRPTGANLPPESEAAQRAELPPQRGVSHWLRPSPPAVPPRKAVSRRAPPGAPQSGGANTSAAAAQTPPVSSPPTTAEPSNQPQEHLQEEAENYAGYWDAPPRSRPTSPESAATATTHESEEMPP